MNNLHIQVSSFSIYYHNSPLYVVNHYEFKYITQHTHATFQPPLHLDTNNSSDTCAENTSKYYCGV